MGREYQYVHVLSGVILWVFRVGRVGVVRTSMYAATRLRCSLHVRRALVGTALAAGGRPPGRSDEKPAWLGAWAYESGRVLTRFYNPVYE